MAASRGSVLTRTIAIPALVLALTLPVAAVDWPQCAGQVYFASEGGVTFVVRAGENPRIVARNDLGERIVASPAIAGGRIFLRSDDRLIAIGG